MDTTYHASQTIYCASVSPSVRCVSTIMRRTPASVSDNVRRKRPSIARPAVHRSAATIQSVYVAFSPPSTNRSAPLI
jgi:hypothetical protein